MAQKAPLLGKCRYVCNVERSMRSCCFTASIILVCRCRQDVRWWSSSSSCLASFCLSFIFQSLVLAIEVDLGFCLHFIFFELRGRLLCTCSDVSLLQVATSWQWFSAEEILRAPKAAPFWRRWHESGTASWMPNSIDQTGLGRTGAAKVAKGGPDYSKNRFI